ncbi:hypothetical protein HYH03_001815 [Edaphochlamys debaryana]|uniref:Uncharacterized protein n=1 Tax=Edaphochlamys debaryana TaxID=47281 RepID=A0A835YC59_9CHLO|nr:hypothetical protein HYH03_001815 [Edaphochlamys debaryana]|eukprot:KAG2500237.1 hypothetical protein HYH03_001815 [Edaphochlamys debaryana]
MRLGLCRGLCARLAAVGAPRRIYMPPVAALGPEEPPSSDQSRSLRPKKGLRGAGVNPSLEPVLREQDIAPVEPTSAPDEPRLSSPTPTDSSAPPAPADAQPQDLRSQRVTLWAVPPGGSGEREFSASLHYKGGEKKDWRLTEVTGLAADLDLVHGQYVEVWILPGGRVFLRPVNLGTPQGSAARTQTPHRRIDAVVSFAAAAEAAEPGTPAQGSGGDVCLGRVRLTWNSKRFLAGPEVLEASFPAEWAAARADKQKHAVNLRACGSELLYEVQLLGKTGHLSSVSAPMQALGLTDRDDGSSVELWRLANGGVEAWRAEP